MTINKQRFDAFLSRLTTDEPGYLSPDQVDEILQLFGVLPECRGMLNLYHSALNIVHYPTMQTLWLSKEHEELTGYPLSELNKDNMHSMISKIHPEDLPILNRGFKKERHWVAKVRLEKLHKANLVFNYRFVKADGSIIHILHSTHHRLEYEGASCPQYSLSILQDVTFVKKDIDIHFALSIFNFWKQETETVWHEKIYRPHALTEKEIDILCLSAAGSANKQIAAQLNITEQTVKNHKYTMFRKVGVKNMVELVTMAKREGWV